MTSEYLADPSGRPAWEGVLPGKPQPYFLDAGEGEHAKLFGDHFTVLVSADETDGQFGMFVANCPTGEVIPAHFHTETHETFFVTEGAIRLFVELDTGEKVSRLITPGDFGFVPAGYTHAYRVEEAGRMVGVASGDFARFFQEMGTPTDRVDPTTPPFVPEPSKFAAVAARHNMTFRPDFTWPDA